MIIEGAGRVALLNEGTPGSGTNEVQTLTVGVGATGTYKLKFGPFVTAAIAVNALATTVQTVLRALASIGAGGCGVSGNAGGPYTVTFGGNLGKRPVELIEVHVQPGVADVEVEETTPGVRATGLGAPVGALCIDVTNAIVYVNTGTAAAPVWTEVQQGPIVLGDLTAGILAASTPGRALMATGYFTEAKATDAFVAEGINGALVKKATVTQDRLDAAASAKLDDGPAGVAAAAVADGKAVVADGKAVVADGKAVAAQGDATAGLAAAAVADGKAVVADGKAVAAQGDATAGLAAAAVADGKAVVAQGDATTGLANAATAQAAAEAAQGDADAAAAAAAVADGKAVAAQGAIDTVEAVVRGTPTFSVGVEADDTIAVTVQLKDITGADVAAVTMVRAWLSDTAGAAVTADPPSGAVTATTGAIIAELSVKVHLLVVTDAAGKVVLSIIEAGEDTWYLNVEWQGKVTSSPAITFQT